MLLARVCLEAHVQPTSLCLVQATKYFVCDLSTVSAVEGIQFSSPICNHNYAYVLLVYV